VSSECGDMAVATKRVIAGEAVWGVVWDEPQAPGDSGFTCWSWPDQVEFRESNDGHEITDSEAESVAEQHGAVCVHCLVDAHPEAGVLLDRARREPAREATVE
jgi:hypothetical protein